MREVFSPLPDESRLWLFALDRPLDPVSRVRLEAALTEVLGNWRHKGHIYEGAWELIEDRLLAIAEPHMATQPSGCAIDGMIRKVHRLVEEAHVGLMDESSVVVRQADGLASYPKTQLGALLASGALGPDSLVVDLALFNVGQLRQGLLEKPLARTWIGRKYKVSVPA